MMYWIGKCSLLCYLSVAAWLDAKAKSLPLVYACAGIPAGLLFQLLSSDSSVCEVLGGCLVGGLLLLTAFFTRQKIGYGDGIVFAACGVFLGVLANVVLLFFALLLTGLFYFCMFILKKSGSKQPVAFLPFVLAGYDLVLLLF